MDTVLKSFGDVDHQLDERKKHLEATRSLKKRTGQNLIERNCFKAYDMARPCHECRHAHIDHMPILDSNVYAELEIATRNVLDVFAGLETAEQVISLNERDIKLRDRALELIFARYVFLENAPGFNNDEKIFYVEDCPIAKKYGCKIKQDIVDYNYDAVEIFRQKR